MFDFVKWFFLIEILGWIAFPLAFSIFKKFKDRGYSISKTLALLLTGYLFWIGNTFSFIGNDNYGVIFSIMVVVIVSTYAAFKIGLGEILTWIRENSKIVLFYEVVFVFGFLSWSFVRATNPAILGTEKPMEQAFIMGIMRSPAFPPADPWLSGYSISYYYFGYLVVAMFMHVAGTSSGIAFNLAISLWFALIITTASGITFNLINSGVGDRKENTSIKPMLLSLLTPIFILIISNTEGFLEVLHSTGFLWESDGNGGLVSWFWRWLDIQELTQPPGLSLDWTPSRLGGTWWWRASRVLQDYTAGGASREIIDEFPFFSFFLADFHPHLISIPFGLFVLYISLYFLQNLKIENWKISGIIGFLFSDVGILSALSVGGLIIINTWDFPIYFGIVLLVILYPRIKIYGWKKERIIEVIRLAVTFGIICISLYLPFLIGLSSQAGGFLPSLIFQTRTVHYMVMFFPLLTPIILGLAVMFKKKGFIGFTRTFGIISLITFMLYGSIILFLFVFNKIPEIGGSITNFLGIYQTQSVNSLLKETVYRFLNTFPLKILLILFIVVLITLLFPKKDHKEREKVENRNINSQVFVYILVLFAVVLSLIPEIFYLRDQFGWRMNTIFKFYYQIWILFSIAASFLVINMFRNQKKGNRIIFWFSAVALITGLFYPFFTLRERMSNIDIGRLSLDGNQYIAAEEKEAIEFLIDSDYGFVSEAIGGSYSSYGRISKLSGLPTVLGWPGHELQWRGGTGEIGSREADIEILYSSGDWERTKEIITQYDIRYIYLGDLERNSYPVHHEKFLDNLPIIFNNSKVTIFLAENE
jgi:YYY domain-containing protein